MKYLKIQNKGELDIRLVALMGGSTKQNDKFKIGKFGTGLKYTLAYLYRNNIAFKAFSGINEIKTSTETEMIGETNFEIICINGNRTSITTQMGTGWSAWMIIRELWCNALDEGDGDYSTLTDSTPMEGEEGKTTFYIQITAEITEVLENWHGYFIHGETPLFEDAEYAIYPSSGDLRLYKNGVLIYHQPETKALFNYDIKGADINELREFRGVISYEVMKALRNPNKEVINYFFTNIKEDHYEGTDVDYDWYQTFGAVWKEAIGSSKVISYGSYRDLERDGVEPEQIKNAIKLPKKVYNALIKNFEGVGALQLADGQTEFYEVLNPLLQEKTEQALKSLSENGYNLSKEVTLSYGIFSDKKKLISLNRKKKKIMIAQACIDLSLGTFCTKLIEMNEFCITGFQDCSIEFKNHLLKLIAGHILPIPIIEIEEKKQIVDGPF